MEDALPLQGRVPGEQTAARRRCGDRAEPASPDRRTPTASCSRATANPPFPSRSKCWATATTPKMPRKKPSSASSNLSPVFAANPPSPPGSTAWWPTSASVGSAAARRDLDFQYERRTGLRRRPRTSHHGSSARTPGAGPVVHRPAYRLAAARTGRPELSRNRQRTAFAAGYGALSPVQSAHRVSKIVEPIFAGQGRTSRDVQDLSN